MKAHFLLLVLLFAGCTADNDWRTKAIRRELKWTVGDLVGPTVEVTDWCPFFATAAACELQNGRHGKGVYVISPKSAPREPHIFYDYFAISEKGDYAPSAAEAATKLREKVTEFNALLPANFVLSNANKHGYAYALGKLLFQGDRGPLEGIGILNEDVADPRVSFALGKYHIRLLQSRSGAEVRFWRIEVTESGHIADWRIDTGSF